MTSSNLKKSSYNKPPLSFAEQSELLKKRGLDDDSSTLEQILNRINYYRLTGYLHPFRKPNSDDYQPNTKLSKVLYRYEFDRKLRNVVMDAVECIEIGLKSKITNVLSLENDASGTPKGAFGYVEMGKLNLDKDPHNDWLEKQRNESRRSQENFATHYKEKYLGWDKEDEKDKELRFDLPLWMQSEIMSFGSMVTLFKALSNDSRKGIADQFSISKEVLESWLLHLNQVRNICAHHARLWNREFGVIPKIPTSKHISNFDWNILRNSDRRLFATLSILGYMIEKIEPGRLWRLPVHNLLNEYPLIPIKDMGFPSDWYKSEFWLIQR